MEMTVFDLTILFIYVIMMTRVRKPGPKLSQQEMAMAKSEVLIVKAKCGHEVKVLVPIVDYLFRSAKKGHPMVSRRESDIRAAEANTCSRGTRVAPDGVKPFSLRGCGDSFSLLGQILGRHL
jgi:hypothetical protein